MTTSTSLATSSASSSNGAYGSSLSRFRSFLRMLNWRRDPDTERALEELARRKIELDRQLELLDKQHAMLDWIESEIDLIEADLPAPSSAACWWRLEAAKAVRINNPGCTWVLGECSLCPVNAHRL